VSVLQREGARCEQPVGDTAEAVDIGAAVECVGRCDLGGMNAGVPVVAPVAVSRVESPGRQCLTRPKSRILQKSIGRAEPAEEEVDGLMSRCIIEQRCASSRVRGLAEDRGNAGRRKRAEAAYELVEVESHKEFHRIVEATLLGCAEVMDGDGMGRF